MKETTRSQIQGMFLGVAIGDALGMPNENLTYEEIIDRNGVLINYIRPDGHKWFDGREAGTWTDDTQLTLLIADSLIEHKRLNLDDLAKRHVEYWKKEGDLGFGPTTRTAIKKLEAGVHWSQSGKSNNSKHGFGNALPMKVSPIGALRASPFWKEQWLEWRSKFIDSLIQLALMTHYRRMAIDSALAHTFAVNMCLNGNFTVTGLLEAVSYWSSFVLYKEDSAFSDNILKNFELLARIGPESMTTEQIIKVFNGGTSYVYNSLPFSYAFFLRNPYSVQTLYEIASAGGDTDTNASIVGGLLGALNGASIFPQHLIDGLWQKDRILTTADKFYETFFDYRNTPTSEATEGEWRGYQCQ